MQPKKAKTNPLSDSKEAGSNQKIEPDNRDLRDRPRFPLFCAAGLWVLGLGFRPARPSLPRLQSVRQEPNDFNDYDLRRKAVTIGRASVIPPARLIR